MPLDSQRSGYEPDIPHLHFLERSYEFLSELGRGGMAAVHLARRRDSGRLVALKAICKRYADDRESLARFDREARTLSALDHPNIVRTLAVERVGGRPVAIVMEYMRGRTLRDALRLEGPFSFDRTYEILRDTAEALEHAHERGIIHRDVKPENIFLDDITRRARLSDFGIARPVDEDIELTLSGMSVGTPAYMSPEQIDGALVDERSDVYSLGLVGWEILTGRRPWDGEGLYGVLHRQKHDALPPITRLRPDVPLPLLRAIEGALPKRTGARWASASEFLEQLRRAGTIEFVESPSATLDPEAATVRFRRGDAGVEPAAMRDRAAANVVADELAAPQPAPAISRPPLDPFIPGDTPWELPHLGEVLPAPSSELSSRARRAAPLLAAGLVALVFGSALAERRGDEVPSAAQLYAGATPGTLADDGLPRSGSGSTAMERARALRARHDSLAACEITGLAQQNACVAALSASTDSQVAAIFGELVAASRTAAGVAPGDAEPERLRRLRVEQRAWQIERDIECAGRVPERERELWGRERARCLAEVTELRTVELRAALGQARRTR